MLINNCLNFMILVMYLNLNLFTFCRSYASSQKHRRCTQYFEFQPRQSSPPLPYSAVESIRRSFLLAEVRTASPERSNSVFSWWEKCSHESHLIRAIPGRSVHSGSHECRNMTSYSWRIRFLRSLWFHPYHLCTLKKVCLYLYKK